MNDLIIKLKDYQADTNVKYNFDNRIYSVIQDCINIVSDYMKSNSNDDDLK